MRFVNIVILCCLAVNFIHAANSSSGEGEFAFVERYNSARYTGLAGGGMASADDIEAIYINPAGLMKIPGHSTTYFVYDYNTTGDRQGILSYGISLNALYIAMTIGYTDFGTIDEIDENEIYTGVEHNPRNMMPMISLAGSFWDGFLWGTNLKIITENLAETDDSQQALGWAFDGSVIYQPNAKNITLALGLYNFGRKEVAHIEGGEENGSLNYSAKFGIGYRIPKLPQLNVLLDLEKPVYDYARAIWGLEFSLSKRFQIRVGMRRDFYQIKDFFESTFGSDSESYYGGYWSVFNAGFGLNLTYFNIDYGIEFLRNGLGTNHRMALEVPLP